MRSRGAVQGGMGRKMAYDICAYPCAQDVCTRGRLGSDVDRRQYGETGYGWWMRIVEQTTLPISPDVFWPVVSLIGLAAVIFVTFAILPKAAKSEDAPLERLKTQMGLTAINSGLFFLGILFWGALFVTLFGALVMTIFHAVGLMLDQKPDTTVRADVILIAGLTATLGAVVALPFTLIRLTLTRDQNVHAGDVLFNEKITEAQRDLYAQRQMTKPITAPDGDQTHQDFWEDDIVRRNAAIDQLERLVDERPEVVRSVAATLSVYVRELSKVERAETPPEGASPDELVVWAFGLSLKRSDMEKAVQTLGRLRQHDGDLVIDLRSANLQTMDLSQLDFDQALMNEAQLQGANLFRAQFQGADLRGAQLQRADLFSTQLQGANLSGAQLQGAELFRAQLQGAYLSGARLRGAYLSGAQLQGAYLGGTQLDPAKDLSAATLRGAALRSVVYSQFTLSQDQVNSLFGDTTVTLPPDIDPPEWFSQSYDDWDAFKAAWRAWQKEIGFDPDDPSTW